MVFCDLERSICVTTIGQAAEKSCIDVLMEQGKGGAHSFLAHVSL